MKNEKLSTCGRSPEGRQFNPSTLLRARIQKYPNFDEEKKCWRRGYGIVVGLDEAGRGPLAGPVVASAVFYSCHSGESRNPRQNKSGFRLKAGMTKWEKIKDSKKLTPKQREEWYRFLTTHPDIKWGIGMVSEKIIDKINIFEATKMAMKKAIFDLSRRMGDSAYRISRDRETHDREEAKIDFLILDGNFTIKDLAISQKAIIRGDEKVFSCAAASIIAKVTRDQLMRRLSKKYPQYGFERHKGYGTQFHREVLKKHGPCEIHRKSFRPVSLLPK